MKLKRNSQESPEPTLGTTNIIMFSFDINSSFYLTINQSFYELLSNLIYGNITGKQNKMNHLPAPRIPKNLRAHS